jgi:hypothetical protein
MTAGRNENRKWGLLAGRIVQAVGMMVGRNTNMKWGSCMPICAGSGDSSRQKPRTWSNEVAGLTVQPVGTVAGRNREHESEDSGMQNCTGSRDGDRQNWRTGGEDSDRQNCVRICTVYNSNRNK